MLARSTKAATHLMKSFSGRDMDKTYWALVNGLPLPMQGTIDSPISKKTNPKAQGTAGGPDGRDYEIMEVDEEEGQKAFTEYRVLDQLATKFALVELKPLTGRTHQLRACICRPSAIRLSAIINMAGRPMRSTASARKTSCTRACAPDCYSRGEQ